MKNGDKELSKELKVKIMRIRQTYSKKKKLFDEDVKDFSEQIVTEELKDLSNKENRTPEEETRLQELTNKANSEYQEFLIQKGLEEVEDVDDILTIDEYTDILDINSDNDVEINGAKVKAADLMEVVMDLFVKE